MSEEGAYNKISSTDNGHERLSKLLDMSLEDAKRHDQKASYFIYISWLLMSFAIIALLIPDSTDDFSIFGITIENRSILLSFLLPLILATEYLQKSRLLLRNYSITEYEEIFTVLFPEIQCEKKKVAYRPGDFIKAERLMNRHLSTEDDKISLNINTGVTILLYNILFLGVFVWLLVEVIRGLELTNPLLYATILASSLLFNKIAMLHKFAINQSNERNNEEKE